MEFHKKSVLICSGFRGITFFSRWILCVQFEFVAIYKDSRFDSVSKLCVIHYKKYAFKHIYEHTPNIKPENANIIKKKHVN